MGKKKINNCILISKTFTEHPLYQILSNLIKNHQIWTKITNLEQKSPILTTKSSNSTKILQIQPNHLKYRIENYVEKWKLMKNEEVGINLH